MPDRHALYSSSGCRDEMVLNACCPETLLFAIDLEDVSSPVARTWSRLDLIKHAVASIVQAKRWTCAGHKFGLISVKQDTCVLHSLGITSNAERFLEALQALQPQGPDAANPTEPSQQQQQQQPLTLSSSPASKPFDVGSLIAAARAAQHNTSGTPAAQPMHGGFLSSPSSSTAHGHGMSSAAGCSSLGGGGSSRSPEPQAMLRVVLVYCRSKLPAPVWQTHRDAGLAVDCLHIHDKPQPGEQQQQLQDVYSALEALVDDMAMRAGHASLIYESTATNLGKLLSCMSVMLSHPQQRPLQTQAQPPVDLHSADLQPLPSDAANLASGVPIIPAAKLPAAAGGAWARPLSAGAQASAQGGTGAALASGGTTSSWLELSNNRESADATGVVSVAQPSASGLQPQPADTTSARHSPFSLQTPSHGATTSVAGAQAASSIVTGVPAGCVTGVPDDDAGQAALVDLDEGVVLGLDVRRSSSSGLGPIYGGQEGSSSSRDAGLAQAAVPCTSIVEELDGLVESLQVSAVEGQESRAYNPKIG